MFNKTASILSAFTLVLMLGFMSCQKDNMTIPVSKTEASVSQKIGTASNTSNLADMSSPEKKN